MSYHSYIAHAFFRSSTMSIFRKGYVSLQIYITSLQARLRTKYVRDYDKRGKKNKERKKAARQACVSLLIKNSAY